MTSTATTSRRGTTTRSAREKKSPRRSKPAPAAAPSLAGLTNIIDCRKKRYRFKKINAVLEATWHDNACKGADKVPTNGRGGVDYRDYEGCSVAQAVAWANSFDSPVTLYLYDEDGGIYDFRRKSATRGRLR